MVRGRLLAAWGLGVLGYAPGLVASTALGLPTGSAIVWALVVLAAAWYGVTAQQPESGRKPALWPS